MSKSSLNITTCSFKVSRGYNVQGHSTGIIAPETMLHNMILVLQRFKVVCAA